MLSADLLRRLRNDLPMSVTLAALGRDGPPAKMSEGYLRLPLSPLRRNARHGEPTQQPRPLLLLQEKPQQHRPAAHPGLRLLLGRQSSRTLAERLPGPRANTDAPAQK